MGDSLITIITIVLAAILLFVFPMMTLADRTDDISQIAAQTATVQFVDGVRKTGKITQDDYSKFISELEATGNTFDVEMKLQRLDENPSKKTAQATETVIGQNTYYSIYTTQIQDELDEDRDGDGKADGVMYLKQGDMFYASAVNNSQTIAEVLKNFFYRVTGSSAFTITAEHTGMVMMDGQ